MNSYTIQSGDTLDSIAAITGASISDLENSNGDLFASYAETDDLSPLAGTAISYPSSSQNTSAQLAAATASANAIEPSQTSQPTDTTADTSLTDTNPSGASSSIVDPSLILPNSNFTLADLTATSQGTDNTVTDPGILSNLDNLAIMLTVLENNIGPFTLISGWRSTATNESIIAAGNPGSSTSFHEQGIAEDFYPTSMSLDQYFSQIITSPFANELGEIYIKPSQNTIHVSLSTGAGNILNLAPGSPEKTNHVGIYDATSGIYRALTSTELAYYEALDPYTGSTTVTIPDAADFSVTEEQQDSAVEAQQLQTQSWIPIVIGVVVVSALIYWAMHEQDKYSRSPHGAV